MLQDLEAQLLSLQMDGQKLNCVHGTSVDWKRHIKDMNLSQEERANHRKLGTPITYTKLDCLLPVNIGKQLILPNQCLIQGLHMREISVIPEKKMHFSRMSILVRKTHSWMYLQG